MTIYFIDYENVGATGLQGINRLKEGDRVVIFHGMNSGSISFDLHLQIFSSAATIEYIRTGKSAKNYLDFQLSTYVGYYIAASNAAEFIIVSRDAGFDSVIDFWTRRGNRLTFRRQASVGIAPPSTMNVIKAAPAGQGEPLAPQGFPAPASAQSSPTANTAQPVQPVQSAQTAQSVQPVQPVQSYRNAPVNSVNQPAAQAVTPQSAQPAQPAQTSIQLAQVAQLMRSEQAQAAPGLQLPAQSAEPAKAEDAKKAKRGRKPKSETAGLIKPAAAKVTAEQSGEPAREADLNDKAAEAIPEGRKKLPAEFKKRVISDLKNYKLQVRGYSVIYALMMKNSAAEEFKQSLANAFQGKHEEIYNLVSGTFAEYRRSLESGGSADSD